MRVMVQMVLQNITKQHIILALHAEEQAVCSDHVTFQRQRSALGGANVYGTFILDAVHTELYGSQ